MSRGGVHIGFNFKNCVVIIYYVHKRKHKKALNDSSNPILQKGKGMKKI